MKKRFIIATTGLDSAGEKKLIAYFRERNMGWWHHIPNFWLVTDKRNTATAEALRDVIQSFRPPLHITLVMEVAEDIDWAVLYPADTEKKDPMDWLRKTWPDQSE